MHLQISVEIEKFDEKGNGIAYFERNGVLKKIIIPGAVIGDKLLIEIPSRKKRIYKGKVLQILTPSKNRIENKCVHENICGGCKFQCLIYKEQLKIKEKVVLENFADILNRYQVEVYPIIPSINPFEYRNKMEFSFSQNKAKTKYLGLMIKGANKYVFNIERCFLADKIFSDILKNVRDFWEETSLLAYNFNDDSGSLRYLTVRYFKNTGEIMVVLTVSGNEKYLLDEKDLNDFVSSILNVKNINKEKICIYLQTQKIQKKKQTKFILKHLYGLFNINEILSVNQEKFSFKISPTSFFQPNSTQAEKIYGKAIELANLSKDDIVYDLYSGTGTIGMIFSKFVKKVYGIEINEKSVSDAKENLKLNDINNFFVFAGDVGKVIEEKFFQGKEIEKPDFVVVDPPRMGLDDLAKENILKLYPSNILYISCNPITQAADVRYFIEKGYELKLLQPIDQFPHTMHIENIALLKKLT